MSDVEQSPAGSSPALPPPGTPIIEVKSIGKTYGRVVPWTA
jgi:hypothetical protein